MRAISPARAPKRSRVSANINQPVAANSKTNGRRVQTVCQRKRRKMRDPLMQRRMVEVGERELARDDQRIGFVLAEAERQHERETGEGKRGDQ